MSHFIDGLLEVVVSNRKIAASIYQAVQYGKMRKIGSRLYSKNMEDAPEDIVRRNWYFLLKEYYPDALIADRTALENKPAEDGSVFIVSSKKRATKLPGITFKPRSGVGSIEGDTLFLGDIYLASNARAYLENMRSSRAKHGEIPRTLSNAEIEERLDRIIRQSGEEGLNRLRDEMHQVAGKLGLLKEYNKISDMISALLGTRDIIAESELANARIKGKPYDPDRIELFLELFNVLRNNAPPMKRYCKLDPKAAKNLAFIDAYFSNFIEGTEFEINEAVNIVFKGQIPSNRPDDAHDILGTFRIVSDIQDMQKIPNNIDELISLLKTRHQAFMALRLDKNPGQFKVKSNQAGSTKFVSPELVNGTLEKGFEIYQSVQEPLHRAIFMMFMISEIHPFTDGNGRAARMMMNAELIAKGEQRIIIPTIYRNNYLSGLKTLTHNHNPQPLIRILDFAQKYTQSIDWNDFEHVLEQLQKTNAFMDSSEAEEQGIRLQII